MTINNHKHKLPDRCTHTDLIKTMVLNVEDEITFWLSNGMTRKEAIARVKTETCAGWKVWEIVEAT